MNQDSILRELTRIDIPDILRIASKAFHTAWSEEDFWLVLRQKNSIGVVVIIDTDVAGYMIFERWKDRTFILQIAVSEDYARQGVATQLIQYLQDHTRKCHKIFVESDVPEDALAFQLLLQKEGFRATGIQRNQFDGPLGSLDSYRFLYTIPLDDRLPQADVESADDEVPFLK